MADQRHVVRDKDRGEADPALQFLDLQHQRSLRHHVERGRRLIHDDQLRREDERHRDHGPLPHAAAQLVGIALEMDGVDAHHAQ